MWRQTAVLFLARAASFAQTQETWPACQEQGRVYRHSGAFGIFLDLTDIGAKEGCWQEDCTKTDKFVSTLEECARACADVDPCKFWTYEPGIRKCFLRSSDAGREDNSDFISGSRSCRPGLGQPASMTKLSAPFAEAALWAAELDAIRPCDAGIGTPGCENAYAAMAVWRYAVNNLRLAINGASGNDREQPWYRESLPYVQQIAADVAGFYRQPTAETFQVAVTNAKMVFTSLKGWLQMAPPTPLELQTSPRNPAAALAALPVGPGRHGPAAATVLLADGNKMPLLGFGTWQLTGQAAYDSTLSALKAGYRHVDTAQAYGNEREVGLAIRDSGVPRSEIFLATKCSDPDEYPRITERFQEQLAALGTDYLDLYMLHTPSDKSGMEAAWRGLEQLHAKGMVRSLGVSNFGVAELETLLSFATVKPVYLQNKFSIYTPGEQQIGATSIMAFAREKGLQMVGYSVINSWPLLLPPMQDPHVKQIAARCGRTPAQVLHRWALQQGVAVLPRSSNAARIEENARLLEFELSEVDMRLLSGIVTLSESTFQAPLSPAWAEDIYGLGNLPL